MKISKALALSVVVLISNKILFGNEAHAFFNFGRKPGGFFGIFNKPFQPPKLPPMFPQQNPGPLLAQFSQQKLGVPPSPLPMFAQQKPGALPPPLPGKIGAMHAYMTCSEHLARSTNPKDFPLIEQCLLNAAAPQPNFQKQFFMSANNTWCNPGFQQNLGINGADLGRVGNVCRMSGANPMGSVAPAAPGGFGQTTIAGPGVLPQPIPGRLGSVRAYMVCSEHLARSTNPKDFSLVEQCLFNSEVPQPNFRKQLSMIAPNTWCNLGFQDRIRLNDADLNRTDKVCQAIGVPLPDVCPYDNGGGYGQTPFGGASAMGGGILPPPIPGKIGAMHAYMTCSEGLAKSTNAKDFPLIEQCLLNAAAPQPNFQKHLAMSAGNTWCNPGFQQSIRASGDDFNRIGQVCSRLGMNPNGGNQMNNNMNANNMDNNNNNMNGNNGGWGP